MQPSQWHKQHAGKPLFPDIIWSRPENRQTAGKLLIIGGNAYGFAAPAETFAEAQKAGIGTVRILLPDALKKAVGTTLEIGEYAPSTPSGSFSQKALAEFLADSQWADAVLIAGDLGRNSETAILLERFVDKYQGQLAITKDAADYFTSNPKPLLERPDTTLVISFAQLQRLAIRSGSTRAFTFEMDLLRLITGLQKFTELHPVCIVTKHLRNFLVAYKGEVSSTLEDTNHEIWRVRTAARTTVWLLQNPNQTFKATTSAIYDMLSKAE